MSFYPGQGYGAGQLQNGYPPQQYSGYQQSGYPPQGYNQPPPQQYGPGYGAPPPQSAPYGYQVRSFTSGGPRPRLKLKQNLPPQSHGGYGGGYGGPPQQPNGKNLRVSDRAYVNIIYRLPRSASRHALGDFSCTRTTTSTTSGNPAIHKRCAQRLHIPIFKLHRAEESTAHWHQLLWAARTTAGMH